MTKEKVVRRSQKEMNKTREMIIKSLDTLEIPEHQFIGRTNEGLVYENAEGLSVVIRVITKQLNFHAESETEDYEIMQGVKAQQADLKRLKAQKIKIK